jgi:hypothetical protein
MGEVVELDVLTHLDLPVDRILKAALEKGLAEVVIIGFDDDGEFYFAASKADGGDVLWLLELAKKKLLEVGDNDD